MVVVFLLCSVGQPCCCVEAEPGLDYPGWLTPVVPLGAGLAEGSADFPARGLLTG